MPSEVKIAAIVPNKIRKACADLMACKSQSQIRNGEKKIWAEHYPKAAVEEFLLFLKEARVYCHNKTACSVIDELLAKSHKWLDKESSPRRWQEFDELVVKLMNLPLYIY